VQKEFGQQIGFLQRRKVYHIEGSHPDKFVKIRVGRFSNLKALNVEGENGCKGQLVF
jgi:hypothetical protein